MLRLSETRGGLSLLGCIVEYLPVSYRLLYYFPIDQIYKGKKAIKHARGLHTRHATIQLFNHSFLSLPALLTYQFATTIYKLRKSNMDLNNRLFAVTESQENNRRSSRSSLMPTIFPRLLVIRRSFFYSGLTTYNGLPEELRNTESMLSFKWRLKEHLLPVLDNLFVNCYLLNLFNLLSYVILTLFLNFFCNFWETSPSLLDLRGVLSRNKKKKFGKKIVENYFT
jgi:hypothetical protein